MKFKDLVLAVQVDDYNGNSVLSPTITLYTGGIAVSRPPVVKGTCYIYDDLAAGDYVVVVEKEGFLTNTSKIRMSRIATQIITISLGKANLPFYYRSGNKQFFDVENTLVGVIISPSSETALAEYCVSKGISIAAISEKYEEQNFRALDLSGYTTAASLKNIKIDISEQPFIEYAGNVVRINEKQFWFLTGEFFFRLAQGKTIEDITSKLNTKNIVPGEPDPSTTTYYRCVSKYFPDHKFLSDIHKLVEDGLIEDCDVHLAIGKSFHAIPTDTIYPSQWNLRVIQAYEAWQELKNHNALFEYGDPAIRGMVIDEGLLSVTDSTTGISYPVHPDFIGPPGAKDNKMLLFYNFISNDPHNNTLGGGRRHGNWVTGIFAANTGNNEGVVGIIPNAKLMSIITPFSEILDVQIFNWTASLSPTFSNPATFMPTNPTGIEGPHIINNSWTYSGKNTPLSTLEVIALDNTSVYGRKGKGVLNFFAAGNEKTFITSDGVIPGHEKVMAIAATTIDDDGFTEIRAGYSSFGFNEEIEFAAPSNDGGLMGALHAAPDPEYNPPAHYAIHTTSVLHGGDDEANMPGKPAPLDLLLIAAVAVNDPTIELNDSSALVKNQYLLFGTWGTGTYEIVRTRNDIDPKDVVIDFHKVKLRNPISGPTITNSYPANTPVTVFTSLMDGAASVNIPAKQFTMNNISGFLPGQKVFIGDPDASSSVVREVNQISAIAGSTITFLNAFAPGAAYSSGTQVTVIGGTIQTTVTAQTAPDTITVLSTAGFETGQALYIGTPGTNTAEAHLIIDVDSLTLSVQVLEPFNNPRVIGENVFGGRASYWTSMGGTSSSCPTAAGIGGLILSANSKLSWVEVREIMRKSSIPVDLKMTGDGAWTDETGQEILDGGGDLELDLGISTTITLAGAAGTTELKVASVANFKIRQAIQIRALGNGEEVRTIIDIDVPNNILKISGTGLPVAVNDPVTAGAKIPLYSEYLGYGRLSALESVRNALAYSHAWRDLMVRDYLYPDQLDVTTGNIKQDLGQTVTDISLTPIHTPDIWLDDSTILTPPAINTFPKFINPKTGIAVINFTGTGVNDLRTRGVYRGTTTSTYEIEIDGTGATDTFKWKKDSGSYTNNVSIVSPEQVLDEGIIIRFDTLTGHTLGDKWTFNVVNENNYVSARILNTGDGGPDGTLKSLDAWVRMYVALSDGLPHAQASLLSTPFLFPTDWTTNTDITTLNDSTSPSTNKTYYIGEVALAAGEIEAKSHTIVESFWNNMNVPADNCTLKPYLLIHVSPHDGPNDGYGAEQINNLSFREFAFITSELRDGTGFIDLPEEINVDEFGTPVNQNFNIDIKSTIGTFNIDKVRVELIKEHSDGSTEYFYFKKVGGTWQFANTPPAGWTLSAPVESGTATPAAGNAIKFATFPGMVSVNNSFVKLKIRVVLESETASQPTDISVETFEVLIKAPAVNPQGYNPLKPEEFFPQSYAFADMGGLLQAGGSEFGPDTANDPDKAFRITSGFTSTTDVNAYAICDGDIIIQRKSTDNDRVNLILRPRKQSIQGFTPVKYFVYRGLRLDNFINPSTLSSAEIEVTAQASTNSEFIASLYPIHTAQNPSLPFLAKALGYDPSAQADTSELDKLFVEFNPDYQYVPVTKGMQIGKFWANGGTSVFGLEIMMYDGPFKPTFKYAREPEFKIDISAITGTTAQDEFQKKIERDKILSFIDPAAFYGSHIVKDDKGKLEVRDLSNQPNPITYKTAQDIFDNVVSKFYTKNNVYIDIRNELSRSYNFFENYDGSISSVDPGKQLLIGTQFTDDTTNNLVAKEYKTEIASNVYNWPLLIASSNQPTSNAFNDLFIKLRIDDNLKPVLVVENLELSAPIAGKFIDETFLVPSATTPAYSNVIGLKIPNVNGSSNKDFASRQIKLRYKRKIDATTPWHPNSKTLKSEHYLDNLFYDFDQSNLWGYQNRNEWVHSHEKRYVDGSTIGIFNTAETGVAFESVSSSPSRYIMYTNAADLQDTSSGTGKLNRGVGSGNDNDAGNLNEVKKLFNYDLSYNLLDESSTPITTLAFYPDEKENISPKNALTMGISETDKSSLLACAGTLGLSNLFPKHLKFQSLGSFTDTNGTPYDKYKLGVHGFKDDGTYGVDYPSPDINVYTTDQLSHVTLGFSALQGDPPKIAHNHEEEVICDTKKATSAPATAILNTDTTMAGIVSSFQSALNAISGSDAAAKASMKTIIETKAKAAFDQAVTRNQSGLSSSNDDRPLYWARLKMACILKNYMDTKPKLRDKSMVKLLYTRSRNRDTVNFGTVPATTKKVLITGFDPFQLDNNIKQSNPSGAAALYLHGKTLSYGGKTAKIQCALFPVRYDEFDSGDVERFFDKYLTGADKVDMIITLSQGDVNYDVERFAGKYRDPNSTDNEDRKGNTAVFYLPQSTTVGDIANSGIQLLPEFLETTLPKAKMVPGTFSNPKTHFHQTWSAMDGSSGSYTSHTDTSLKAAPAPTAKSLEGSGSNYLSNEIFYRCALIRTKRNSTTKTGHLHLPILQYSGDIPFGATLTMAIDVENMVKDAISGL
jgi:pyrrolidone-carboxylate peptidase